MEEAVLHIGDLMCPVYIKSNSTSRDGKLDLIPITLGIIRSIYNRNRGITPSDPPKAVLHLLTLEFQFFPVGHVPGGAAAAIYIIWTLRLLPGGEGDLHLHRVAPGAGPADFVQLDPAGFPFEGPRHKAGHAVGEGGHPLSFGVVAVDGER